MHDLISTCRWILVVRFGHCSTCMRQSLAASMMAWVILGTSFLTWPHGIVQSLIGFGAVSLTVLWLMHIVTYAVRVAPDSRHQSAGATDEIGRRTALGHFLRAAGAAVAVSVPVLLWPSKSFAFCGQCTKDADCGVGFRCRNTAPVNSGKICNECVR